MIGTDGIADGYANHMSVFLRENIGLLFTVLIIGILIGIWFSYVFCLIKKSISSNKNNEVKENKQNANEEEH